MPTFRQQPLTWLFFAAIACLDAVALATNHEAPWADGLLLGQLVIVGAWWALGRSHRLARAAVALGAVSLFLAPDYIVGQRRAAVLQNLVWPHVLGTILVIMAVAAAFTWCMAAIGRAAFGAARPRSEIRWQISIAEILGWMAVVAIIAALGQAARFDQFLQLARSSRELTWGVGGALAISGVLALSLGNFSKATWPGGIVESAWLVLLTMAALIVPEETPTALGACLVACVWTIARKLDGQREAAATDELTLRLHNESEPKSN